MLKVGPVRQFLKPNVFAVSYRILTYRRAILGQWLAVGLVC